MKISDLPAKQTKRYLADLHAFPPHRQLLVKVGGGLLEDEVDILELAEALGELAGQGIHTLLVHGGGPQLSRAMQQQGVEPRFVEGVRYTEEATLKLAEATFNDLTAKLVKAFQQAGVDAVALQATELLKAKRDPALGSTAKEIAEVDSAAVTEVLANHSVAVLNSLASDQATGQILNVNADIVFRTLAHTFKPHRMTSLSPTGGVLKPVEGSDDAMELISGIDVRDVEALIADGTVSGGMALKLRELAAILEGLETGSAISITKPADLLTELLTDQGSGTFVGKGQKIITGADIHDVLDTLAGLIKEVFGKSLPAGYADQPFEKIYFTADKQAFAIVTHLKDGTPYLDKLAVSPQLQGRGIGEGLWYKIAADFPVLLWRSHVTNRYATWYHRHADIMLRQGEWILFGLGADFETLEAHAAEITAIPAMQ